MPDRTCSVDGCNKVATGPNRARGFCSTHYRRFLRYGDPEFRTEFVNKGQLCSIVGCGKPAFTRRLCNTHDARLRRLGTTDDPTPKRQAGPPGTTWCGRCRQYLLVAEFYRNRATANGLASYCKSCSREASQARAAAKGPDRRFKRKAYQYRATQRGVARETYTRLEIAERDGWRCQLCGKRIDPRLRWPHPQSFTIDHIVPLTPRDGDPPGEDVRVNVQAAHSFCNTAKGNRGTDQLRLFG